MDINTLHKPPILFREMSWYDRFIVFCGVGFRLRASTKAPGTFGSAFALLFRPDLACNWLIEHHYCHHPHVSNWHLYLWAYCQSDGRP